MALTAYEESRVRDLLAQEDAEKRNKILKNIASFIEWLSRIFNNLGGIDGIEKLYNFVCVHFLNR